MWRGALLAVMLLLALAPVAFAQDDEDEADDTPPPAQVCERGPGTDADYADCPGDDRRCEGTDADYVYSCCREVDGTDADYVYGCPQASSGGGPPPSPPPPAPPRSAVQALATPETLPLTGGEPLLIALAGAGLLLAGAGLRLRST